MTIPTAPAHTAWELAKERGVTVGQRKVELGFNYLRKSTTDDGYIGYHTQEGACSAAGRSRGCPGRSRS